jgi:predicted small lipoprotein YifL
MELDAAVDSAAASGRIKRRDYLKMKRVWKVFAAAALVFNLAACGQKPSSETAPAAQTTQGSVAVIDPASIKTIGDGIAANDGTVDQYAAYQNTFLYAFANGGKVYRLTASLSDQQFQAIMDLDFSDPDVDAKRTAIISPLKVEKVEELTSQQPKQADLDALIGKTGQDLLNDGWTQYGFSLDEMKYYMNKGAYAFEVVFEGRYEGENPLPDDFDGDEFMKPLKVKSVTCTGIGDAVNIEG